MRRAAPSNHARKGTSQRSRRALRTSRITAQNAPIAALFTRPWTEWHAVSSRMNKSRASGCTRAHTQAPIDGTAAPAAGGIVPPARETSQHLHLRGKDARVVRNNFQRGLHAAAPRMVALFNTTRCREQQLTHIWQVEAPHVGSDNDGNLEHTPAGPPSDISAPPLATHTATHDDPHTEIHMHTDTTHAYRHKGTHTSADTNTGTYRG